MKRILAVLTALCLLGFGAAFPVMAQTELRPVDVGNFNDYTTGGGSWDTGGSNWNYSSDYSYYGSSGGSGSGTWVDVLIGAGVFAVIVVVVILSAKHRGKKGSSTTPHAPSGAPLPDHTNEITAAIRKFDENFSLDRFTGWVKEVFITLQEAWTAKDWSRIRPFEKEELFQQHAKQLQQYIDQGRTNHIERIAVNQAYPFEYRRETEYEYLKMYLDVRMIDYVSEDATGKVVMGDKDNPYFLRYLLTFMRRNGVKTDAAKSNHSTTACPHCGAPTQITSAGKCEYCGFIITTGEHDWVLSDISAVKGSTHYGSGGVFLDSND